MYHQFVLRIQWIAYSIFCGIAIKLCGGNLRVLIVKQSLQVVKVRGIEKGSQHFL